MPSSIAHGIFLRGDDICFCKGCRSACEIKKLFTEMKKHADSNFFDHDLIEVMRIVLRTYHYESQKRTTVPFVESIISYLNPYEKILREKLNERN